MYKAGDKFEIVESKYRGDYWKAGNIVEFVKPYENLDGVYSFKEPGRADGYFLNFGIEGETHFHSTVRPLRTEAEKRGAKFGVMGVLKQEKKKCVYLGESLVLPGYWEIDVEGKSERWHRKPSEIRLDHEPEYREIPFSEATHEQRMDVSLVVSHDGEKPIDALFTKGSVYVYQFESMWLPVCIHACSTRNDCGLKIRIPT